MESNEDKKKPIFEPVSAEEAKKIRAGEGHYSSYPPSGVECESGGDRLYDPCKGKYKGDWCCYDDGKYVFGICEDRNSEDQEDYGPAEPLRCNTNIPYNRKL